MPNRGKKIGSLMKKTIKLVIICLIPIDKKYLLFMKKRYQD